jgi:hypothetical protein
MDLTTFRVQGFLKKKHEFKDLAQIKIYLDIIVEFLLYMSILFNYCKALHKFMF